MGNVVSQEVHKHAANHADASTSSLKHENASSRIASRAPVGRSENLPMLQLSCNGEVTRELSLYAPSILIGRSDDNDLVIPSHYVSRHHILIVRHRHLTILVDLNSTNGTFVNSTPVYSRVLVHGDEITVDRHSMFVEYSVTFSDPLAAAHGQPKVTESLDAVISDALAKTARQLGKTDTDLLPALTENVPTEMGIIDDR